MGYRDSHLEKGNDYDIDLEQFPMDHYMADAEARILSKLVPRLFPNGVNNYLDFAGGTGRVTRLVEAFASESTAIDISESMQSVAKRKCKKTHFILADITKEPIELEPFELVTAFRFFGNAEESLRESVLRVLSSMIIKDGYLIFNNHRNPLAIRELLLRFRGEQSNLTLNPFAFRRLLKKYNFKIVQTIGIATWVIRAKYEQKEYLTSKVANILEYISCLPGISIVSPDSIVIAKKLT